MFERLISKLNKVKQTKQMSIAFEADQDGYLDKECPIDDCLFQFKVNETDWKALCKDEKAFCPLCRKEAKSDAWFTTEQIEEAKKQAIKHINGRFAKAIDRGTRDFNSKKQRSAFIKMSVKVSGTKKIYYLMPVALKEAIQLKIQCKVCYANYAVIGSAFFCPCCGHNSVKQTFDNSLKKIQDKIKNIPLIRQAVETVSKDEAATTCRSLIETSLDECVVAFQRFFEVHFTERNTEKTLQFNPFKTTNGSASNLKDVVGVTCEDWVTDEEVKTLNLLFQKRRLLTITEGIIDQQYLDTTSDNSYTIGQRIVIKEKDVLELISLVDKLVNTVRNS